VENGYVKDYAAWSIYKQTLDSKEFGRFFHEREVWWCALGVNVGTEQDGKNEFFERPVLILKKVMQDLLLVAPVTSRLRDHPDRITANIAGQRSQILLSHMRAISCKRLLRRIGRIKTSVFQDVILGVFGLLLPDKSETPHEAGNLGGP